MAFLGGLFRHHSQTPPDSLFGGVLQGSQDPSALAGLAASTGNYSGADLPPSRAPVPYRPQMDPTASAGALPAPQAAASAAPGMPGPDDIQRRLSYAKEIGIPIEQHHFNWGHAIASFFGGAAVAQAYMRGDYNRAASLNAEGQLNATRNKEKGADMLQRLSVYSALRDSGVDRNTATIAMTNMDELGKNFNTRFRTDDIAPGHTRRQPNLDGTVNSYTAPNLVQHGADYQFVTPSGINSSAGDPPLDGNGAGPPAGLGAVPPSAPRLPAPPDRAATLGRSGRQISMPGADDGEADALVRQGIDAGASVQQITGALKSQFGYSDEALGRVAQLLGPALQWKQQNPNAPYRAEVSLGAPDTSPQLPSLPRGAPMLGRPTLNAPRANVVAAGSLRTDAEQYADALGLTRGSPEWLGAVKDAMLKANGPTAFRQDEQLQGQRLGVQMRGQDIDQGNNIRTTGTSAANNMRSTNASMANRNATPAAVGVDGRGNTTIVYPNNRVVQTQGIRPVSASRGRGRLGGAVGPTEGATATGPGGHKIVVRGGRWVDAQSGRPLQ